MNEDNLNTNQQPTQQIISPQTPPQTTPALNQPVPVQNVNNNPGVLLVILLLSSFIIPGLGLLTVPLVIYFAIKGIGTKGKFSELNSNQKLIKIIGWICITLVVGFVGLITLIILIFSSGDFKMG